ncbi:hypothetical protein [Maribacter sp. 2307ULW6-5]|uniref:hypothetical protein n=1 Tax=Maribacter sp. 2307ULW6-5 TaxID=3386275 RepID=UPI0039BD5606
MTESWQLLRPELFWPVLLGSALVFAAFLAKILLERNKPFLWARILLAMLAVGSLAMLLLTPAHGRERETGSAILLTQGYDAKTLDSLKAAHKGIRTITYDSVTGAIPNLGQNTLVWLLGQGIEPYDFWQLENRRVTFLPGKLPSGISRVRYDDEVDLGSATTLLGEYLRPAPGSWLLLKDPSGTAMDSLALHDAPEQAFRFQLRPKAVGQWRYQLVVRDSTGREQGSEPLPIQVRSPRKPRVLLLNGFPTFESKYLKNFLADKGHSLTVRNQLTTDRYRFEHYNAPPKNIYGLTQEGLKAFDLVVTDTDTYNDLSGSSRGALLAAVGEQGLGLFLLPTGALFSGRPSFFHFSRAASEKVVLGEGGNSAVAKHPYRFAGPFPLQRLFLRKGQPLAGYVPLGKGKVGTTLLKNTYPLLLKGEAETYAQFWSEVLPKVAKGRESSVQMTLGNPWPRPGHPLPFEMASQEELPSIRSKSGAKIPLLQNVELGGRWQGRYYPKEKGWNQILARTDTLSFYVHGPEAWKAAKAYHLLEANQKRFNGNAPALSVPELEWHPLPPFLFFVLLLLSLGTLWFFGKT